MKIAGIILAAGGSTRMGGQNKLLQMVDGISLVQRVVRSALNSNIESVYVILGYQAALIRQCISNKSVNWVENSDWSRGMASSIKSGIEALNTNYDGAMILLGDMPFIEPIMINQLLALYQKKKIVVPVKDGRQGNPVLFSSAFFADLKLLGGDKGAKPIIKKNPDSVIIANVLTDTIFHDLDIPDQIKERIGNLFGNMKINYIDNDIYDKTNSSFSLWLGVKNLNYKDALLILEGDVFFERDLLIKFIEEGFSNSTIVQKYNPHLDGSFVELSSDMVIDWVHKSVRPEKYIIEDKFKTVNIHKFDINFVEDLLKPTLKEHADKKRGESPMEYVMQEIITKKEGQVHAFEVGTLKWFEIDDVKDLKIAEGIFQNE